MPKEVKEMAQDFYENWKKSATGRKVLLTWVRDPEGLLTGNGHFEGVYEFRFVNDTLHLDLSAYIGQAGNDKTAPAYVAKDVYERVLQHLKRWLGGDYFSYWTGLDANEDADWKIEIHTLAEEQNHTERLKKETECITKNNPFLQDTANGLFGLYPTKYGYRRNDLCIHPWTREGENEGQRRLAFLHRVKEMMKSE